MGLRMYFKQRLQRALGTNPAIASRQSVSADTLILQFKRCHINQHNSSPEVNSNCKQQKL